MIFLLANWKWIAGAVLLAGMLGGSYRLGGNSARTTAALASTARESAAVRALEIQIADAKAESVRRQGVIDDFQKARDIPDPVAINIGSRVLKYALGTSGCIVSKTGPDPGADHDATGGASSAQEFERLFDEVGRAISHDAAKIKALQQIH